MIMFIVQNAAQKWFTKAAVWCARAVGGGCVDKPALFLMYGVLYYECEGIIKNCVKMQTTAKVGMKISGVL